MYFAGIQSGLATLYGGHVAVTIALLQALAARSTSGYARILFTRSVQPYIDGSGDLDITYGHGYTASKRALLSFAHALRRILDASGLAIKDSTLNPLWVHTDIAAGTRPYFCNLWTPMAMPSAIQIFNRYSTRFVLLSPTACRLRMQRKRMCN